MFRKIHMARKQAARSREEIVRQLLDIFFRHGFNGSTLSLISATTGLGRASLYHHFPGGKEEMARAVLERADAWGEEFVTRIMTDENTAPKERLLQALKNMDEVHFEPDQLSPANALIIGESTPVYRSHIASCFLYLTDLLSDLMQANGIPEKIALRRAWEFRILWEGALASARVMNDMGVFRQLMQHMPSYLLAPAEQIGCLPSNFVPPCHPDPKPASTFEPNPIRG